MTPEKFETLLDRIGVKWEKREVPKNNSVVLTGYMIGEKRIRPTIYEDMIRSHNEVELIKLIEEVINGIDNTDSVFTVDNVRLKVYPAVRSKKWNKYDEDTVTVPTDGFDDLETYFYIKLEQSDMRALGIVNTDEDGTSSVQIHKGLMNELGLSIEELKKYANINMHKEFTLKSMTQVFNEMLIEEGYPFNAKEEDEEPLMDEILYVASNIGKVKGAGILASKECMKDIKEFAKKKKWGSYAILPSSVHEVLIAKVCGI